MAKLKNEHQVERKQFFSYYIIFLLFSIHYSVIKGASPKA